jgi:hypothetical protein
MPLKRTVPLSPTFCRNEVSADSIMPILKATGRIDLSGGVVKLTCGKLGSYTCEWMTQFGVEWAVKLHRDAP